MWAIQFKRLLMGGKVLPFSSVWSTWCPQYRLASRYDVRTGTPCLHRDAGTLSIATAMVMDWGWRHYRSWREFTVPQRLDSAVFLADLRSPATSQHFSEEILILPKDEKKVRFARRWPAAYAWLQ